MGEKNVSSEYGERELRSFTRSVLDDLQALEQMLSEGLIENGVRRIGAEQEMFLVDPAMRPASLALEVIEKAADPRLTTEIGRFNLEANPAPLKFDGRCLSELEAEIDDILRVVRSAAAQFDAGVVLAGILPTIQQSDLTLENITPIARYHEINRVVSKLHGENRYVQIKGVDELQLLVQDTSIEFCNTSFQIHLQVGADELARAYNWAQAVAAPVLACAANAPLLLNNHLWEETRIALFQHATDTRSYVHQARRQTPRVNFGDKWVEDSVISMLHEDAVRFRFLLTRDVEENAAAELDAGRVPELSAWRLHNGTIWRWNRICYGVTDGRPGLRIETRFLPAGPSVADEIANAAFHLGLMTELLDAGGDVRDRMLFDHAKQNFFAAARYGLKSQLTWLDGRDVPVHGLILNELLPLARAGLDRAGIDKSDIERFLGIIEKRVAANLTGAAWMTESLAGMDKRAKPNVKMRSLTAAMKENQETGKPVTEWEMATIPDSSEWIDNYKSVEQFMASDLYTVRAEDALDLAANLMDWRGVRHVPVENDAGELVGLISYRDLLRMLARGKFSGVEKLAVRDAMRTELITVSPCTSSLEALELMREKKIGCLPVVREGKLVGVVTAYDFLTVGSKLFEEKLKSVMAAVSGPNGGPEDRAD